MLKLKFILIIFDKRKDDLCVLRRKIGKIVYEGQQGNNN